MLMDLENTALTIGIKIHHLQCSELSELSELILES